MKRVLIVGASGFVGSNLAASLRGTFHITGTFARHRPIIDQVPCLRFVFEPGCSTRALIELTRPDAVIYCAAIKSGGEKESLNALYVNANAPKELASLMEGRKGQFIYFSSHKVFPGDKGGYLETAKPSSTTTYGKTKIRGEELVREHEGTCVLRLGTVFGLGSKFHDSIFNRIFRRLREGRETPLISDEMRSIYGIENVVRAVKTVLGLDHSFTGLYHLSCKKKESYYTLGKSICETFNLPPDKLTPVTGEQFNALHKISENRGKDTSLNGGAFAKRFCWEVSGMKESVAYLREVLRKG